MLVLGLWLFAVTVRQDATPLRAGCSADAETVSVLKSGDPVTVRFSMTGDLGTCYKVSAGDKNGYVPAAALAGLEEMERGRVAAPDLAVREEVRRFASQAAASAGGGDVPESLGGAIHLIEANQPRLALDILERKVLPIRRDPSILEIAGYAAYRSDQPQRAKEYWTESLRLKPNPQIQQLMEQLDREQRSDKSDAREGGAVFSLRYEEAHVSPQVAREMIDVLEDEYARVSSMLGCHRGEKLVAIVQSESNYRDIAGAAWSGGQFDGRIRVPLIYENGRVGPRMRRVFAHEIVHACLAQLGSYPAWFHEGLAQKLSGDHLSPDTLRTIRQGLREGSLPKFENLAAGFGSLSAQQAGLAYALALAGIETLGEDRAVALARTPEQIPAAAAALTRAMIDR